MKGEIGMGNRGSLYSTKSGIERDSEIEKDKELRREKKRKKKSKSEV